MEDPAKSLTLLLMVLQMRSMSIDERSCDPNAKFASLPRNNSNKGGVCTSTMPRPNKMAMSLSTAGSPPPSMMRMTSDPMLSPRLERRHGLLLDSEPHGSPPPKPSRVPCLSDDAKGGGGVQPVYHASGSDSGNGSGDSVQSSADAVESSISLKQQCGVVIKNPARSYTPPDAAVEPVLEPSSAFDLDSFATLLLPVKENKPLDASAMQGVKLLLLENGSRVIANHLTKVDLELTHAAGRVCPPGMQLDLGLGVHSGIELCSLPHGHQLRLDLIERYVTHFFATIFL
jgi:SH2 domain-containing protein 3C